jgi:hypothetical protein
MKIEARGFLQNVGEFLARQRERERMGLDADALGER